MDLKLIEKLKEDYLVIVDSSEYDEKYKWQAIKKFQDSWNPETEDFQDMLKESLSGSLNLLANRYFFPMRMLLRFCEVDPERVKEMFLNLFNEKKDLMDRIQDFASTSVMSI